MAGLAKSVVKTMARIGSFLSCNPTPLVTQEYPSFVLLAQSKTSPEIVAEACAPFGPQAFGYMGNQSIRSAPVIYSVAPKLSRR